MEENFNETNAAQESYLTLLPKNDKVTSTVSMLPALKEFIHLYGINNLKDVLGKFAQPAGKRSFLVFTRNKYINIRTEDIAYFYVKYDSTIIVTFQNQEFFVNYSLDQIQHLVSGKQFFRLNRQYVVSFDAIKEVEHYFARKLLVNAVIPTKEKWIVSKEKVTSFFNWMDNR